VILDLTLPDISGIEVFRTMRERWPDLPVVFSTGNDIDDIRDELHRKRVEMLRKPYEACRVACGSRADHRDVS